MCLGPRARTHGRRKRYDLAQRFESKRSDRTDVRLADARKRQFSTRDRIECGAPFIVRRIGGKDEWCEQFDRTNASVADVQFDFERFAGGNEGTRPFASVNRRERGDDHARYGLMAMLCVYGGIAARNVCGADPTAMPAMG